MAATISTSGTFKTIAAGSGAAPTNEGGTICENDINNDLAARSKLDTDQMGFQELQQFVTLFANANSLNGPTAIVRLRHMLEAMDRDQVPISRVYQQ